MHRGDFKGGRGTASDEALRKHRHTAANGLLYFCYYIMMKIRILLSSNYFNYNSHFNNKKIIVNNMK